jgi:hypothetical protein
MFSLRLYLRSCMPPVSCARNIEANASYLCHNACIALDYSENVLLAIHVSPHTHSTFDGHDSLGKANFFFTIVEGQHNLHDGKNVFPSVPYYRIMLHKTQYAILVLCYCITHSYFYVRSMFRSGPSVYCLVLCIVCV